MPQQLIYTSSPRGLVAGRSGHCTVARSAAMREALMLHLEKLSYYQHLSLSGGQERPICACRVVDIRGSRFHVLSRIQDAGLDFTGRTNFIAHHLVLAPEELRPSPVPPVILRDWSGWVKSWTKEPQLLEQEDWSSLTVLAGKTCVPAQTWQRVTGDAVSGYGLLEARAGASFRVDDQTDETVLGLFAESMELLEVRDTRRDFRAAAWQYTFTTSMQEQDNPADFRWRCIHSDNPAANRFATPDCCALSAVRATKCTGEETAFARAGRRPPRFVAEPQDMRITEGETARFQARAEGVPNPSYQWFSVDRARSGQILAGENGPELVVANPPLGLSRYVVRASNSAGEATSKVATLSVEQKIRLQQTRADTGPHNPAETAGSHQKSADDIDSQRKRLQVEQAKELFQKRLRRNKILVTVLAIGMVAVVGVFVFGWKKLPEKLPLDSGSKKESGKTSPPSQPTVVAPTTAAANRSNSTPGTAQPEADAEKSEANTKPKAVSPPLQSAEPDLPSGWKKIDIGTVGTVSSSYVHYEPNAKPGPRFDLTVSANGFFVNGDSLLFVYKTNVGTQFIASLTQSTNDPVLPRSAERGIMIRESEAPNSPFLFIGASLERIFAFRRDSKMEFYSSKPVEIPKMKRDKTLCLRFDQQRDLFTPAYSFDSKVDFKVLDSFESCAVSTNHQILIGFALCSGSSSNKAYVRFVDISPPMKPTKKKLEGRH